MSETSRSMYGPEIKENILLLINSQREIQFLGGLSENFELYQDFLKHQKFVLSLFDLQPSRHHLRMLSKYPFSPYTVGNNITPETRANWEYNDELECYFLEGRFAYGYGSDIYRFFTVMDKTEYLFSQLSRRQQKLKEKGRNRE